MLFELETGRVPDSELERSLDMGKLVAVVEGLFSQQKFPAISTGEAVGEWINLPQLAVVGYQSSGAPSWRV